MSCSMPRLLRELAVLDGRRESALLEYVHRLRRAGCLPPSRHGMGHTPVDAAQMASLLLAVMGTDSASEAVRACEVYRGLKPLRRGGFGEGFGLLTLAAKAESLGLFVENVIANAPQLEAQILTVLTHVYPSVPIERLMSLHAIELELRIQRPVPFATAELRCINDRGLMVREWRCEWRMSADRLMAGGYASEMAAAQADRSTESVVSHRTLFALGRMLAGEESTTTLPLLERAEKENAYA